MLFILTKTLQLVSWQKLKMQETLDVIHEDEDETEKAQIKTIILSGHHSDANRVCFCVGVFSHCII